MKYAIVPVEWCLARGVLVTPEERKSLDGTLVIKHLNMLSPFVRQEWKDGTATLDGMDDGRVKVYAFDDPEFLSMLSSDEWTAQEEEGQEKSTSTTSDYGVLAGIKNAEMTVRAEIQTMSLTDGESLEVKDFYPEWEDMLGETAEAGKQLNAGEKYQCDGKLWKVLQSHAAQSDWRPGQGTESLFTEVVESAAGTLEDPIPYNNNMELENGKYYSQDGVTYLCTRDTGIPVYNPLSSLVGIYVQIAKE